MRMTARRLGVRSWASVIKKLRSSLKPRHGRRAELLPLEPRVLLSGESGGEAHTALGEPPVVVSAQAEGSAALDIDGDGSVEGLTDGLLVVRHLFGFEGEALIRGVVAEDAIR